MPQDEKRILVVDDEEKVGFFLSRSLTLMNESYQVQTARSGEEALEILRDVPIDLLITDLRMPGISGLDLIRWVRDSSPDTRVVLITAYGDQEIKDKAQALDVYRYLAKPFSVQDFTEVVQGALSEGALSAPGMVAFSDETFEAIVERLETLRYDINAQCIFLSDMQGQRLTAVGNTEGIDDTLLLTLLAGGFATSAELARQFGSGKSVNLNFHEGSAYDIYSANVDESLIIALVYDRSVQKSRVGMVWLYTRRAIEDLSELVASMDMSRTEQTLDADFGDSLLNEFDAFFEDEHLFDDALVEEPEIEAPAPAPPPPAAPVEKAPPEPPSGAAPTPADEEDGDDHKLFSLQEAIEQGLIPSNLLDD